MDRKDIENIQGALTKSNETTDSAVALWVITSLTKRELVCKAKDIHIPVHGLIPITYMAKYFMDNRFFQRLNDIKQLGTCNFIFPGATHTRFEHSLGTYYLAERILNRIKKSSDKNKLMEWLSVIPELKLYYANETCKPGLNKWIRELIKIAALCHDIGHGPYSHIFDDIFIKNSALRNHPMATHESRSCAIVEKIVQESSVLSGAITYDDIKFIQSLINPTPDQQGFVYQIVSNHLNGLDVDKYDYIARDTYHLGIKNGFDHFRLIDMVLVIDNKITYREQDEHDIYNLFTTRHSLHRRVYAHKGVISAQYIITNIMTIIDKVLGITESINDINKFAKMTDVYITEYTKLILEMKDNHLNPFKDMLTTDEYLELESLHQRLQTHNLFPHIGTTVTKEPIDIKDYFNNDKYRIFRNKVGFVSGNKLNPLDMIYVYKTKDKLLNEVKAYRINKKEISCIIPDIYQEHILMVFRKDNNQQSICADKLLFKKLTETIGKL